MSGSGRMIRSMDTVIGTGYLYSKIVSKFALVLLGIQMSGYEPDTSLIGYIYWNRISVFEKRIKTCTSVVIEYK